jgi:HipA-like kinase
MQTVEAQRVIATYRAGSSWPVLVETSRGVRFTKLRGAGQGTGALVAEIIVSALCDALGLNTPARSLVQLPRDVESADRNDELRWLLDASEGLNLGFAFLDGAKYLELSQIDDVNRDDAAAIVWLDGLVMNPDRTRRNPNLMWWHGQLWLIDHGAALGFQYAWSSVSELSTGLPMPAHEPHLLRERVTDLEEWDELFAARVTREVIEDAVAQVPDDFLAPLLPAAEPVTIDALRRRRAAYVAFLWKRLKAPRGWVGVEQAPPERRRGRPDWLQTRPNRRSEPG